MNIRVCVLLMMAGLAASVSSVGFAHEGHGLDAIPHDLLHFGWLLLIPAVFAARLRAAARMRAAARRPNRQ